MSFNAYTPPGLWDRTRMARFGFIAGAIFGIGVGWFFHGLISLIVRFGIVMVLVIPILLIAWFWWRSSRTISRPTSRGSVMTWTTAGFPGYGGNGGEPTAEQSPNPEGRRFQDTGQIYDLDELKRQQERNR
ncbi:MAG: hypothetical protein ACR2OU_09895 [Thermomicrobiales bacterium]